MALSKGIKVQASRFSALHIDSDSDSEASGGGWTEVAKVSRLRGKEGDTATRTQKQHRDDSQGDKPLSKSAKKRARKKKTQQSSSESKSAVEAGPGGTVNEESKQLEEREQEAADIAFQKELEEALLQSKLTAEQEKEIEKQRKAAAELKKQSKKGVKLTLQALHRGDVTSSSVPTQSPKAEEAVNNDSAFFERLGQEVESEMRKRGERRISEPQMSPVEESARVAQVMDELEKRDKTIVGLRRENEAIKSQMTEVKGRNQQLCKILAQGEFSSKTQLLEQIEELTAVKNELTTELQSHHSQLEQERSRNKTLQIELTKHTSKMGKNRHN